MIIIYFLDNNVLMTWLNYHHLYYFWTIAEAGTISAAAKKLRLSQSALSTQLKELEQQLGHVLVIRGKRQVTVTEAGKLTLEYANTIFSTGNELVETLKAGSQISRLNKLRLGAVNSLSKNLQIEFIKPLLDNKDIRMSVSLGSMANPPLKL